MQIQKIGISQGVNHEVNKNVNNKSNISFGYDPVVNAEFIKACPILFPKGLL